MMDGDGVACTENISPRSRSPSPSGFDELPKPTSRPSRDLCDENDEGTKALIFRIRSNHRKPRVRADNYPPAPMCTSSRPIWTSPTPPLIRTSTRGWSPSYSCSRRLSVVHSYSLGSSFSATNSYQQRLLECSSEEITSCESDFTPRFSCIPSKVAPSLCLKPLKLNEDVKQESIVKLEDGVWRGKCAMLRTKKRKPRKNQKEQKLDEQDSETKCISDDDDEIFASEFLEFPDKEYLGIGASARVVKALHCKTAKVVALKRVRSYDQMYQSETEMASMCLLPQSCPQLVKLLAFWRDGELEENVLALEYMDLGSLDSYIRKNRRLTEDMCCLIARELCKGLAALHELNLIHRDIKPANILLGTSGAVKICDFGLLYKCDGYPCKKASGTLKYFSPERVDNCYGPKADVWALGVVLFECAEGVLPALSELEQELVINQENLILNSQYSRSFVSFLSHCLEKDPKKRWSAKRLLRHPFLESRLLDNIRFDRKPPSDKLFAPLLRLLMKFDSKFKYHEDATCVQNIADYCGMPCESVRRRLFKTYNECVCVDPHLQQLDTPVPIYPWEHNKDWLYKTISYRLR